MPAAAGGTEELSQPTPGAPPALPALLQVARSPQLRALLQPNAPHPPPGASEAKGLKTWNVSGERRGSWSSPMEEAQSVRSDG